MIRYAGLAFLSSLAILTGATTIAETIPDCKSFNSAAFFAKATPEDVAHCLERNASLLTPGAPANAPVLYAVRHSNTPLVLDVLLDAAKERGQLNDVLGPEDRLGRSILHVAAAEARDPAMIPWLAKWGADVLAKNFCTEGWLPKCTQPIHLAASRKDGFLFLATLMAIGADASVPDRNDRALTDLVIYAGEDPWNNLALLGTSDWPNKIAALVSVSPDPTAPCDRFLTSDFFVSTSLAQLTHCLNEGAQVITTDRNGNTALHHAAAHAADPRFVDLLLLRLHERRPEDVERALRRTNKARMTPLHHAAHHGASPEAITRLLAWGADPNALAEPIDRRRVRRDIGTTPLHLAARNTGPARRAILTVLLAAAASPTLQDHGPVGKGGRQALHYLMQHDPDVREVQLMLQAELARHGYVKSALENFVRRQPSVISDVTGATALHWAARYGASLDVVKTLVDYGFSSDARESNGMTPLMYAAKYAVDEKIFFLLLENSDDPCHEDRQKTGIGVKTLLDANEALRTEDQTGRTITPLAALTDRCS